MEHAARRDSAERLALLQSLAPKGLKGGVRFGGVALDVGQGPPPTGPDSPCPAVFKGRDVT